MDSYNLTNGLHMSQNKYFLVDVVKKEWGFDGLMTSDGPLPTTALKRPTVEDLDTLFGAYTESQVPVAGD